MSRENDGVSSTSKLGRSTRWARWASTSAGGGLLYRARKRLASEKRKEELELERRRKMADEMFEMLGEMKGLAMKFGQQASYRTQRGEGPMQESLSKLLQDAPTMDAEAAAAVVERELGSPPDALFAEWEPEPVAAASIGQVHQARTHDGRLVAVKVQYPGAAAALAADADALATLLKPLGVGKGGDQSKGNTLAAVIELLKQRLVSETDYIHEAADTKLMAEAFRGHPFIHIPEVLAEFSSANVLTTEFAVGARYHDVLGWDQEQRDLAGEAVFRFHYRCIYLVGRHSADPHPGNYVFGPDGALWCLDFGAMWDTSPDFVSDTERLLEAVSAEGVVFESDPEEDEEEDGDTEAAQAQAPAQAQQGDHEQQGQPEGAAPAAVAPVPRPFKDAVFVGWLLDQCGCGEERQLPFPGVQPRGPGGNVLGVHFDDEQRDMAKRLFGTHRGNVDTLRAMQAVVATLGSRRDWGAIAREYWPFTAAPPSTPLGELEARWQEDRR